MLLFQNQFQDGSFHERNGIKGIRPSNRGCHSQDDGWEMSTITWMPRAGTQPFLFSRLWLSFPISSKIKTNSAEPLMGLGLSLLQLSWRTEQGAAVAAAQKGLSVMLYQRRSAAQRCGGTSRASATRCLGCSPVLWSPCPLSCWCAVPHRVLRRDPAGSTLCSSILTSVDES